MGLSLKVIRKSNALCVEPGQILLGNKRLSHLLPIKNRFGSVRLENRQYNATARNIT